MSTVLGRNGRQFYRDNYDWPVVERKYLQMFERLKGGAGRPIERLPGWLARRRHTIPAANDVLATVPAGAAIEVRDARRRA